MAKRQLVSGGFTLKGRQDGRVFDGTEVFTDDTDLSTRGRALSTEGGVSGVNVPAQGLVTSDSASKSIEESKTTLDEIGSNTGPTATPSSGTKTQLDRLFDQLSATRAQLTKAKEKEKLAKENLTDVELQSKLGEIDSSEEGTGDGTTDLSASVDSINKVAVGGKADTSTIEDPTLRAMTDAAINNISLTQQQMTRLGDFAKTMSAFSQAEVDDISATALRSIERQIAENDRVTRSLQFAGVIGGRAQFAPTPEGTLIHEIVQDGLDKIDVIEANKNTAIRQARQAETEFNYTLFTDSVALAKQFNTDIETSITNLKAEVRQAEKDENDRLTFRQQQEERNALILAEELVGSTPEQIAQTAVANGVDVGLLTKAVNDASFEQSTRDFEGKKQNLDLRTGEQSLVNKQLDASLKREAIKSAQEIEKVISEIPKDVRQGLRSVARLSDEEMVGVWSDIQETGLNRGLVETWMTEGIDKAQVKKIVTAHEQSQQVKGDDGFVNTKTEDDLHNFIDNWTKPVNIDLPTFKGQKGFDTETFFKK